MIGQICSLLFTPSFVASVIRVTAPILFAALGGIFASRSGIFNMALESMLLWAALVGVIVSAAVKKLVLGGLVSGDAGYEAALSKANIFGCAAGFIAGVGVSVFVGLFLAYMGIKLKADLYLTGLAINTISTGGTVFVLYLAAGEKGISTSLSSCTMPVINIPFIENIPIIGTIFSGQNVMVWIAFICIPIVHIIIDKTTLGLRIRAVGENPNAAESVGVDVQNIQFKALALSGLFAGMGGISLSMASVSFFSRGMSAGKGFMAMSAMNVGRATPLGTAAASIIFGVFDAASNTLKMLSLPTQFIAALPYAATLVALVVFAIASDKKAKKLKALQDK